MRLFALSCALLLAACFDYAEQVTVGPTGAGRISVRYSFPDWLAAENPHLLTDGGLTLVRGERRRAIGYEGDVAAIGYEGDVAAIDGTRDAFLSRSFKVREGGLYRYELRIAFPATYAAQVSASIERYAKAAPFMNVAQLRNMRENALRALGPRFRVQLPGEVLASNGNVKGGKVEWKVPLRLVLEKPEIVLYAEGRLGFGERLRRMWSRRFAPLFDRR